ncbi:MAG: hypothetical protein AAF601_12050 [Pseudomonadota bacterium]
MIASLPMYWRDETAEAWRGFWSGVQAAASSALPPLIGPNDLPEDWTQHWLDPNLLLSQTCSYPLRTVLRDRVTYVGTFDFGLDAPIGYYYSRFVKRARGVMPRRLAINSYDSQSGFAAGFEPLSQASDASAYARHVDQIIVTGSHTASLRAVADGRADGAYIDAVTYRLCKAFDPWGKAPFLAGRTRSTPGLPLITARGRDPAPLRAALAAACETSPWMGHRALGGLRGVVVLDEALYHALPTPRAQSDRTSRQFDPAAREPGR